MLFEVMAEPRRAGMNPASDSATPKTYSTHKPVNTVTDVLSATEVYYLNASYYQYMLNLHKYKVTKRP
ncbi:hypothetical protein NQ318_001535 [Aromia moschata]|uniref:Uncharacterized protein n=1 Tax=Aromia moschata TaxID=1265417 RepID=A0AAV8YBG1_9CUCU|nr:hypothetical protein NQ318_001535 [Aromia moschata]